MVLRPTSEKDAGQEVKGYYQQLKKALNLPFVPIYFRYIGSFPLYCRYIINQVEPLVNDENFTQLTKQLCKTTQNILDQYFPKEKDLNDFILKLKDSPSYYHFQKDIKHIFQNNAKLVFIFIAIREAVKGWAVAAKKITAKSEYGKPEVSVEGNTREAFIYEDYTKELNISIENVKDAIGRKQIEIKTSEKQGLSVEMLPIYLKHMRQEYESLSKTERFLYFRVEMEKTVVAKLELLPQKIESPINVVLELTQKYPCFSELLHLLSDQFPTTAMQRFMFSGWLLP